MNKSILTLAILATLVVAVQAWPRPRSRDISVTLTDKLLIGKVKAFDTDPSTKLRELGDSFCKWLGVQETDKMRMKQGLGYFADLDKSLKESDVYHGSLLVVKCRG